MNLIYFSRAKKASARNFEIIDPNDPNIIYLLHGKVKFVLNISGKKICLMQTIDIQ